MHQKVDDQEKIISDLMKKYGIVNVGENKAISQIYVQTTKNYVSNLHNEVANTIYNDYIKLENYFEKGLVHKVESNIGKIVFFEMINSEESEMEFENSTYPVKIDHYIFVKSFSPREEKNNYGLLEITFFFAENDVDIEAVFQDIKVYPIEKEQIKQIFNSVQENSANLKNSVNRQQNRSHFFENFN